MPAVAAAAQRKLPKLVSCFILISSDNTSEVCESGAGAAGAGKVSALVQLHEAVDDTNLTRI